MAEGLVELYQDGSDDPDGNVEVEAYPPQWEPHTPPSVEQDEEDEGPEAPPCPRKVARGKANFYRRGRLADGWVDLGADEELEPPTKVAAKEPRSAFKPQAIQVPQMADCPDLAAYFSLFGVSPEDQVQICRKYANYLSQTNPACRLRRSYPRKFQ